MPLLSSTSSSKALIANLLPNPSSPPYLPQFSHIMLTRTLRTPLQRSLRTFPSTRHFSATPLSRKVYENVDASTFQSRVLTPSAADADTPVLVDFFATWCQPCKLLSPALKKVASNPEVVGGKKVDLVTIDVDQHQEIAQQFKVSAMPTVIAMKGGKVSIQQQLHVNEAEADPRDFIIGVLPQVLDGFVGMLPEKKVIEFVQNLK